MKRLLILPLTLGMMLSACDTDDDDDSPEDIIPTPPTPYLECSFGETTLTTENGLASGQKQTSGIVAYSILADFGGDISMDIRIPVQTIEQKAYTIEGGTSIRVYTSSGTFFSIDSTGTVDITDLENESGKGTFSCMMTNFSDTVALSDGKFEHIYLPD